eukprot:GFYU01003451.1.p1 GENE.GFYU01003451.1~~GFYU01003451.1.p1  ORF type:complete len:171 (-),score=16.26 GFYU01003451.1:266-778(-)
MGAQESVIMLPCPASDEDIPGHWREQLQERCNNVENAYCVIDTSTGEGSASQDVFEAWQGWVTSIVQNLQTGNIMFPGTIKLVLILGANQRCRYDRMQTLALCEHIRARTRRHMLIKHVTYQELMGNDFNADGCTGIQMKSDDLLAHNAWTDPPYYFYKRANQHYLAFTD